MNIHNILDKEDFEMFQKYFLANKNKTFFFSTESLKTIDNENYEHLFFQNVLNKQISRESFQLAENKIISLLEYFYIISDETYCFPATIESDKPLKKQRYVKQSKDVKIYLDLVADDIYKINKVDDINKLRGLAIIGIREIGNVCFGFQSPDILVMVDECKGIVCIDNERDQLDFTKVSKKLGLDTEPWKIDDN